MNNTFTGLLEKKRGKRGKEQAGWVAWGMWGDFFEVKSWDFFLVKSVWGASTDGETGCINIISEDYHEEH